ncbi:MAG TPA: hypothetical protein VM029_13645 [Opitutaceae bacterium]|nr:hypothetical protein [Opitutaceae bacterium]
MFVPLKRLLALFLVGVATVCAQVETIDLGARGKITLYLAGDWKFDLSNLGNNPVLTIKPTKESVNAECTISVTFPETDRFDTKARLKLRVEADNRGAAEAAVEGKAIGREFSLTSGFGFYCNLTDPDLRGKPPEKGNFKNASVGKIRLAPDVLIDVSIMADGFTSEPYQQLLGAVEGMEFSPGRGRRG